MTFLAENSGFFVCVMQPAQEFVVNIVDAFEPHAVIDHCIPGAAILKPTFGLPSCILNADIHARLCRRLDQGKLP